MTATPAVRRTSEFVCHGGSDHRRALSAKATNAYSQMFFADHYLHTLGIAVGTTLVCRLQRHLLSAIGCIRSLALIAFAVGVEAAFACAPAGRARGTDVGRLRIRTRRFTSPDAASYAAIGAAVLPSIYLSAHVFGQLPTLTARALCAAGFSKPGALPAFGVIASMAR